MSQHDHGVTELLRRASDDLTPDVDRLVSGGITRGRSRQRRARIGTTVASLAVIGVIGALAAVVPLLAPDAPVARDADAADDTSESPTPTPTPTTSPAPRDLVDLAPGQVPAVVDEILGTTPSSPSVMTRVADDPGRINVSFTYEGMVTDIGAEPQEPPTPVACRKEGERLGGTCVELPDGTLQLTWGPTLADQVTCQGATVYHYGHEVWATSCNALQSKDYPPSAPLPPLSLDQLVLVAGSDAWFASQQ